MTQQRISAYEKGKREPDIESLKQIANYFNCSIDYLLGKTDIKKPKNIDINDLDVAFASGIKGLNKENQEIAKNIIEGLLAKQENEEKNKNSNDKK